MSSLPKKEGAVLMGFGKIFDSTFTGSMVGNGPTVFAVWAYVIANTRPPGLVELNPVILAAVIGTSIDDIERAISVLTNPDPRSRTKIEDGRRLIAIGEFSYSVPTWQQYRDARNDDERKAYNAEAQRKHRLKMSNFPSLTVNDNKHPSAQAEAEAEAIPTTLPTATPRAKGGVTEGKDSSRIPTTPQSKRFAAIFHRRETTPWQENEVSAYQKLGTIPADDLVAVEGYYAKNWPPTRGVNILRTDLLTFLNNFQGEVGRARADEHAGLKNGSTKTPPEPDPTGWREWLTSKNFDYTEHARALPNWRKAFDDKI